VRCFPFSSVLLPCGCCFTGSFVISRASRIFSSLQRLRDYTQLGANVYLIWMRFCGRGCAGATPARGDGLGSVSGGQGVTPATGGRQQWRVSVHTTDRNPSGPGAPRHTVVARQGDSCSCVTLAPFAAEDWTRPVPCSNRPSKGVPSGREDRTALITRFGPAGHGGRASALAVCTDRGSPGCQRQLQRLRGDGWLFAGGVAEALISP
jgi:hypothetical protein